MMSSKAFLIVIVVVAAAVGPAMAKDYMVGDNDGWTLNYNYTNWAAGKEFHVGDTLTFMYTPGSHNVVKVTGADFKACNASNSLGGPYNTGNDTFTLGTSGNKWYFCSIGNHCDQGMKLVISVAVPGPAPAPESWAPPATAAGSFGWMIVVVAAAFSIIVA